ncbi:MAG TPA: P22 phage major capsid protein family protein, partial [Pseudonocardia sp.]|uniref:P22 phage major capsid protein family protein n=1 Tax=Pseudonocardia sp. TaxID=60912 RepID=UPI002B8DCF9E
TMDNLVETKIDVTLDTAIYSAVPTTDEEETLDIVSYGTQILTPMVRAVAEGAENKIAKVMQNATYATTLPAMTASTTYETMVDARRALNDAHVPMTERYVVIGSGIEAAFLKDPHLSHADQAGDSNALRDADIGSIAGFQRIVVSQALDPWEGYAFHRTAYSAVMVAPKVPQGASFGARQSLAGVGMRWIKDYDFRNAQDRSMVDVYMGCNYIADGPASNEVQTVTVTGTPTGGSFTLTYQGKTTAAIAYNATAAQVKAALVAGTDLTANQVSVANGPFPGTAVVVTFDTGSDVAQMTATGSLTGGTTPAVAVTTTTAGGAGGNSFVRAVKLTMTPV